MEQIDNIYVLTQQLSYAMNLYNIPPSMAALMSLIILLLKLLGKAKLHALLVAKLDHNAILLMTVIQIKNSNALIGHIAALQVD